MRKLTTVSSEFYKELRERERCSTLADTIEELELRAGTRKGHIAFAMITDGCANGELILMLDEAGNQIPKVT